MDEGVCQIIRISWDEKGLVAISPPFHQGFVVPFWLPEPISLFPELKPFPSILPTTSVNNSIFSCLE